MTGKELLDRLQEMGSYRNIDIPVAIQHMYLDIVDIEFCSSTDGKVPYINIKTKEELKILNFD